MLKSFIKKLEKEIEKHHLSTHPFYQMWNEGTLSKEALQKYAQQYYQFVEQIPRLVGRVYSNTPDRDDRLAILENLNEEEDPNNLHEELWIDFAQGIGVKNVRAKTLPETRKCIEMFREATADDPLSGMAALLAYEGQIPEIAELKMKGLKEQYGITDKKTLGFFAEHAVADIEHQKTWKNIIAKHAKTPAQQNKVLRALRKGLKANWLLLDGVYNKYC